MLLKDHLLKYTKDVYPMHMPGHKAGRMRLIEDFYKVDVTEVADTDHLYKADGILADSMAGMADFYGTKKTVYLVNGSTVGILSAIGGLHEAGDEILIARNCHHSVYNAITLFNLKPKYVYPRMTQWGITGGIHPEDVKRHLAANPRVVCFVMTSPTYDGFLSDIRAVSDICKRYNVTLIVDEAHGAHLPYSHLLPKSAIDQGAEVVIHSVHKTLPVVTGASLMHLNLPSDQEEQVLKLFGQLQTSSPSYIMMANVDACVQRLGKDENMWTALLKNIEAMNVSLKKMKKLFVLTDYSCQEEGVYALDPFKSILITRGTRENGHDLASRLRTKHKIQLEMADAVHGLGILSPADTKKAMNRYVKALMAVDRKMKKAVGDIQQIRFPKAAEGVMTPYEASTKATVYMPLAMSVGRISAEMIIPYPPGIPVVAAGEPLTEELIGLISDWESRGIDVLGLRDGHITVLESD